MAGSFFPFLFCLLLFTTLLQFVEVCRLLFTHSFVHFSPQHFSHVEVWTAALFILLFLSHSVADSCCVWDHCPVL